MSPTLASAPGALTRMGVQERLSVRQHLIAAWGRQPRRTQAQRRRGQGWELCTAQATARNTSGRSWGQQCHSAERPSTTVTERDPSDLLAGRPLITKEERERSVPTECHTGSRLRGGRAGGSLKSCSQFSCDRKTARDRQGLGGSDGSREGLFPTRLETAGRGRWRERAKMREAMGAGE